MKKNAHLAFLLLLVLVLVGCDAETVPAPTSISLAATDIPAVEATPASEPTLPAASTPTLEPTPESDPLFTGAAPTIDENGGFSDYQPFASLPGQSTTLIQLVPGS